MPLTACAIRRTVIGSSHKTEQWSNSGALISIHLEGISMAAQTDSPVNSSGSYDHQRAEEILASVEGCRDAARRERALQEAVLLTLDLADTVAKRYRGRGIEADDLLQVARMALVKAVRGYRSGRGNGFAAYAVPTMAGEIKRHFRDCGWAVRPPRRLQEIRAGLAAAEEDLRQANHREPTPRELAESMELGTDDIRKARECCAAYHAVSLDLPTSVSVVDQHFTAHESDAYEAFDLRAALGHALGKLSERDRAIVRLRFVEERTQSEIGEVLGVSQMQVSRLLAAIVQRLRDDLLESESAA
jgi:RNA polymerase sigma-B factor